MVPSHQTLIDMHTNMQRHAHVWGRAAWPTCACLGANTQMQNALSQSVMMLLLLSFRCERMLALPRPPVCPDLREHPRLLWMLMYLWFPLICWWQELWRCVCVGCVFMLMHVAVCFCEFVRENMCVCVFVLHEQCWFQDSWILKVGHCTVFSCYILWCMPSSRNH